MYTYIIIGASSGIGKYIFEYFSLLSSGGISNTVGTYNKNKVDKLSYVDVTNEQNIRKFIAYIQLNPHIILINCAGINYNSFAHKTDLQKWKEVVDVNLIGLFNVIKEFLPIMRQNKYGRIINLSSVVPQIGVMGTSSYSASKSALWGMTKTIAKENAELGITINNLNLGYFDVGMTYNIPENIRENIKQTIPMKKFGHPDNILNAIHFLIHSDYITGTSIDINGGLY
jgi:acetoacetyl-CoA reductase/3-oxoacyl-[acyl-carrier protein] reductase